MKKINVMVTGLPGNMASLIATKIITTEGMELNQVGLSHKKGYFNTSPEDRVLLAGIEDHIKVLKITNPDIVVDFSKGSAEANCKMYCDSNIPFVMGSTGGDYALMAKMVQNSGISAVIAPNMAAQVVAIQAMLEFAANNFPGVFNKHSLTIAESHQKQKIDPSGTAKLFEELFNRMGAISDKDGMLSIRDPLIQKRLCGIPEEFLSRHGYHEYVLKSEGGTVSLGLVHNINGRNAYIDGAIKAILFLATKGDQAGNVYSMVDVLRKS